MHSSRPLLASAAPRSLGWHLPPLGEPTLNPGRASVFKGCATPPGGNAGQPCRIGLSKVCQIFGTARVDTLFSWHLTVSWPWDWITSVRKSNTCARRSLGRRKSCSYKERAYRPPRLRPCCSGCSTGSQPLRGKSTEGRTAQAKGPSAGRPPVVKHFQDDLDPPPFHQGAG